MIPVSFNFNVDKPLEFLWKVTMGTLLDVLCIKTRLDKRRTELHNLEIKKRDIMALVEAEERILPNVKCSGQVTKWFADVSNAASEFQYLEITSKKDRLNLLQKRKLGYELHILADKLKNLADWKFDALVCPRSIQRVHLRTSETLIGVENTINQVWDLVRNGSDSIIGLYGRTGIGKTDILTKINNKMDGTDDFDLVIWLSLAEKIDVEQLINGIVDRLELGERWKTVHLDVKRNRVLNILKDRRWLLLLDDLQEPIDVKEIGFPIPNNENGCKVVFTCKSKQLCGLMKAGTKFEVEPLAPESAWTLFEENVGEEALNGDPAIREVATKICERCYGIPDLLIKTGRQMSLNTTLNEWKMHLEKMKIEEAMKTSVTFDCTKAFASH